MREGLSIALSQTHSLLTVFVLGSPTKVRNRPVSEVWQIDYDRNSGDCKETPTIGDMVSKKERTFKIGKQDQTYNWTRFPTKNIVPANPQIRLPEYLLDEALH